MKFRYTYNMPIGNIVICEENDKITGIYLDNIEENNKKKEKGTLKESPSIKETLTIEKEATFVKEATPLIKVAKNQLDEYFNGKRKEFDFPMHMKGTQFQVKVWEALRTIPYGKTCSYKEVAIKIGNPKASRAVGMANNKNPLLIVVPCHRVIGANGSLVGYACGLHVKENLLQLEGQV